jgi:hypothetical protein
MAALPIDRSWGQSQTPERRGARAQLIGDQRFGREALLLEQLAHQPPRRPTYDKVLFILEPSEQAKTAIGKRVTVVDYPDGRLSIRYRVSSWPTAPSTRSDRSTKVRSPTTSGWVQYWRMIRNQQLRRGSEGRNGARRHDQRDARLFKSAELLYEPSVLASAQ